MKKLYVGNLPFQITEEEISEAFGRWGSPVSVKLIVDRETGRGRGFGFVEMESADLAQTVVDELDGKELFGRTLKIDIARDKPPRDRQPRQGGGFNRGPRGGGERNFNR